MSKGPISRRRSTLLTAAAALVATGAATSAMAGAFALREQSAVGQGMSFAGVAAGGGDSISGMFWNPAVINQVEGYQGEQHVTGIFPSSDVDVSDQTKANIAALSGLLGRPGAGATADGGNIGQSAVLTSGYNAYRINDKVVVGLSITSPFGLVTDPKNSWAGQTLGRSSKVLTINATPTVGYEVNDWLSVAAGLQIQYFAIALRQATGVFTDSGSAKLDGHDVGFGFTAGLTLKPLDGTEIGVGYRSATSYRLKGDLRVDGPGTSIIKNSIKADVTLPDQATIGIRQRVTESFTVLGGFEWTNWSRFKSFDAKSRTTNDIELPFNYKDGYFASIGGEYAVSPDLTVRAGAAYEWSPIDNKSRTVRLPDDDRVWLSTGLSYNYSKNLGFDLGYSYVFVPGKSKISSTLPAPIPPGLNAFNAKAESDVHIVSAALRYKFGGEAAPALVTKY